MMTETAIKNNKEVFPVLEVFTSIQGEGRWTGTPSIFVRVAGCNLRCVFGNSRCDTPYSSFELEKPLTTTVKDAVALVEEELKKNPNTYHIVITGGEPMLYQKQIKEFVETLARDCAISKDRVDLMVFTIETNGTMPCNDLDYWEDDMNCYWIDLFSISPKLSTSVDHNCKFLNEEQRDRHDKLRINIKNLSTYVQKSYNGEFSDVQLKFVYTNEDSVTEIKDILNRISEESGICMQYLNERAMLMPEGTTNDHLNKISQECAQVCIREGWKFCDRLHIRIWGDKRGV